VQFCWCVSSLSSPSLSSPCCHCVTMAFAMGVMLMLGGGVTIMLPLLSLLSCHCGIGHQCRVIAGHMVVLPSSPSSLLSSSVIVATIIIFWCKCETWPYYHYDIMFLWSVSCLCAVFQLHLWAPCSSPSQETTVTWWPGRRHQPNALLRQRRRRAPHLVTQTSPNGRKHSGSNIPCAHSGLNTDGSKCYVSWPSLDGSSLTACLRLNAA